MNNSATFEPAFSHLYIEERIAQETSTKQIIAKFPKAKQILIGHYKDLFCRSRQHYGLQKQSPKLILAKRENACIYEGAKPCQSFGREHFYYMSSIMNCIYDCEYCYLQGMYPSANLVVFVNLEEEFRQVQQQLSQHPLYLCVSYDTDLLALEGTLGYVRKWVHFAAEHPDLTIEVRTKSGNYALLADLNPQSNVIFAWTLSPREIIESYEHGTASLQERLRSVSNAARDGWPVRLCFDPVLMLRNWKTTYGELLEEVFKIVVPHQITDISIGPFRVAKDALKRMRKNRADSALLHYPYQLKEGIYQYGETAEKEMLEWFCAQAAHYIPREKIFVWQGEETR